MYPEPVLPPRDPDGTDECGDGDRGSRPTVATRNTTRSVSGTGRRGGSVGTTGRGGQDPSPHSQSHLFCRPVPHVSPLLPSPLNLWSYSTSAKGGSSQEVGVDDEGGEVVVPDRPCLGLENEGHPFVWSRPTRLQNPSSNPRLPNFLVPPLKDHQVYRTITLVTGSSSLVNPGPPHVRSRT